MSSSPASKGLRFRAQKLPIAQTISSGENAWVGACARGVCDRLLERNFKNLRDIRRILRRYGLMNFYWGYDAMYLKGQV